MTEQLTGVGSEQSGNPAGGNGEGVEGSTPVTAATDSRSEQSGNPDWAKSKGWVADDGSVKAEDVFTSYRNLEQKLGSMITVPGEKATPEEQQRFYKALGVPEKADGYQFKLPEGLPKDLPHDQAAP